MSNSPVYLIEFIDSQSGELLESDVTAFLENALDLVSQRLLGVERLIPEVALGDEGELEGIAFFNAEERACAFITAYYLTREEPECEMTRLLQLARGPLENLQAGLAEVFG